MGGCHPAGAVLAYLTPGMPRRTVPGVPDPEGGTLDAEQINAPHDELQRLRAEVAELRASRARLVCAADAGRRGIERDLHDGVQQHLIALAVNIQLVAQLVDADPTAAKALLAEMERDLVEALDETARLAQQVYAALPEAGGLAAALRAAAVSAGVPASVEVSAGSPYPAEISRTVYLCWLESLDHAGGEARATAVVREENGALSFEFVGVGRASNLEALRDRVEALGGGLTTEPAAGHGTRIYGSLPLSR
jgi:signal transduction histidine kinase